MKNLLENNIPYNDVVLVALNTYSSKGLHEI